MSEKKTIKTKKAVKDVTTTSPIDFDVRDRIYNDPERFSYTEAIAQAFADKNIIKDTKILEEKYRKICPDDFFSYKSKVLGPSIPMDIDSKMVPLIWDSMIIPKSYEELASSFSEEEETFVKYLRESDVREAILDNLSNPDKLKDLIAASVGSSNGQVNLNGLITSTIGIFYATSHELKELSQNARRCVSTLIYKSFIAMGIPVQMNDWKHLSTRFLDLSSEDGILEMISDYKARLCLQKLPVRDIIPKGITRTTCFELANAICLAHSHFLTELRNFHDFEIGIHNVLLRLKYFIRGESQEKLGDTAFELLSSSDNFRKIASNLTLINLALAKPDGDVDTEIARWAVEDERIAIALTQKSELFDIVGPDDLIKMFDSDVVFSSGPDSRKVVLLSKSYESNEVFRGFRLSRVSDARGAITRDIFIRDERMNLLNIPVEFFSKLDISNIFMNHLTMMVSYHDKPIFLSNGLSDQELLCIAMALNRRTYIDIKSNKIIFAISKSMTDDGSRGLVNIIGEEGFTDDPCVSLFITAPVAKKAVKPWVTFNDLTNFSTTNYYSGMYPYLFNPFKYSDFEHASFLVSDSKDPSINHKLTIDVDFRDALVSSKRGVYAVNLNRAAFKNFFNFALYYSIMARLSGDDSIYRKHIGWAIVLDEICKMIIKPLYERSGPFEMIIKNKLWRAAQGNDLISDSMYIDYQLKFDVKVVAVQLMLGYAGFDIQDIKEFISDNKYNILRNLINVNNY